jgi:hypothetical protein
MPNLENTVAYIHHFLQLSAQHLKCSKSVHGCCCMRACMYHITLAGLVGGCCAQQQLHCVLEKRTIIHTRAGCISLYFRSASDDFGSL